MNQEGIDHLRLGLNLDQVIAQARTRLRLTDRDNFLHAQTRHRIDGRWMLHRLRDLRKHVERIVVAGVCKRHVTYWVPQLWRQRRQADRKSTRLNYSH